MCRRSGNRQRTHFSWFVAPSGRCLFTPGYLMRRGSAHDLMPLEPWPHISEPERQHAIHPPTGETLAIALPRGVTPDPALGTAQHHRQLGDSDPSIVWIGPQLDLWEWESRGNGLRLDGFDASALQALRN